MPEVSWGVDPAPCPPTVSSSDISWRGGGRTLGSLRNSAPAVPTGPGWMLGQGRTSQIDSNRPSPCLGVCGRLRASLYPRAWET